MQTIEFENTLNLSVLPTSAQQELVDFYQFLVEKYTKENNKYDAVKIIAPRLVKEFKPLTRDGIYE
jgi:CTP-dependent riboflavin kinase